jgi:hypothetical protein
MSVSGGVHRLSVGRELPALKLKVTDAEDYQFIADERTTSELLYPVEEQRGYEFRGLLWIPGRFEITMHLGQCVTMIASVEDEDVMLALSADDAGKGILLLDGSWRWAAAIRRPSKPLKKPKLLRAHL